MSPNEQTTYDRIALGLCVFFFGAWTGLLTFKYFHLGYYDWDLAFYAQACWNLVHGSQFVSLAGINYFGDHACFITFFTLPFFALFPHPLTLIVLKIGALAISAFLLYRIFCAGLGPWPALGLMLGYWLLPANIFSLLYEYNPESLAVVFIVLMFSSFEGRQWKGFWVSVIGLMLIKENLPLLTAAFGVYGWCTAQDARQKKHAGWAVLISLCIFWFFSFVLVPHFRHMPTHAFVVRYRHLGRNPQEIIFHLLRHPGANLMHYVLTPRHLPYLSELFGPWWVPALLGLPALLVGLPVLMQHLLSTSYQEHSIFFHYGMTLAPIIFLAAYKGLCLVRAGMRPAVFLAVIGFLVFAAVLNLKNYAHAFQVKMDVHQDELNQKRWALIRRIPPDAGVVATFEFLAPLSMREKLYSFHKIYDDSFQAPQQIKDSELNIQGQRFFLPKDVSYALIDFKDLMLVTRLQENPEVVRSRIKVFLSQWKLIEKDGDICLYSRGDR